MRKGGMVMKAKSLVLTRKGNPTAVLVVGLIVMFIFCFVPVSYAATAKEIEANVDGALKLFDQVKGGKELLSAGWKVGADGSVAAMNVGAGASVDSTQIKDTIVSVIFGQRGLMANATIEGAKLTKIVR